MSHCKDCKHWHRPDEWENKNYNDYPWCAFGVCGGMRDSGLISLYVNDENLGDDVGEDSRAALATREDFGCVLWEAKANAD